MAIEQTTYTQRTAQHAMRSMPFWAAYDLVVLAVLALMLPLLLFVPIAIVRVPLGLAMALIAPGYALVAALFPRRDEMGGVVRAALSFGLSAAILPLLALALDRLPWGIHPLPITISLAAFTTLAASVGLVRRALLRPREAALPPRVDPLGWWGSVPGPARASLLAGALALALMLGGGAYALLTPDPSAQLTEFYVLGRAGLAEDYPREVTAGAPMQATLGITNREGIAARYRVEVRAGDALLAQAGPAELASGASWQESVSYTLDKAGNDQHIDILLFRDDATTPYRTLHLWVNVVETSES